MTPVVHVDSKDLDEAFDRLAEIGEHPAPALTAIGRVIAERVREGFQSGVDPYGRPWAPLKTRSGQPLRASGHLMASVDYDVEGNSVEVGTNRTYARVHQFGTVIEAKPGKVLRFMVNGQPVYVKRVTIPARPMFPLEGLPQQWETDALEAIGDVMRRRWAARDAGPPAA